MTLISPEDFQLFTGTPAPDNFTQLHDYVVKRLERALGIFIPQAERTELLYPYSDGRVYPHATPITAVPAGWLFDFDKVYLAWIPYGGTVDPLDPDGYTAYGVDSNTVPGFLSASVDAAALQWYLARGVDLTYTGGWAPYGSNTMVPVPFGDNTQLESIDLPADLAEAIAWGILTKNNGPQQLVIPHGVQSMNVAGEISVTRVAGVQLGADNFPIPRRLFAAADLGGRCLTLAAPYRRLS